MDLNTKIWWLNKFLWLTTFKQLYSIHKSLYSYELLHIAFQQIFIEDWLDLSLMFILFHNQNIYYDKNKNEKTTFKIFPIWRSNEVKILEHLYSHSSVSIYCSFNTNKRLIWMCISHLVIYAVFGFKHLFKKRLLIHIIIIIFILWCL